jgi:MarR family transcriptional regulator, transcriptional regulator for hemolysin
MSLMGRAIGGNVAIERRLIAAQGLSVFDGHALAGLLDAEGCFRVGTNNAGRTWSCTVSLNVRMDDGDVVEDLCRSTGLGRISVKRAHGTSRPQTTWSIASKRECAELVGILRRFPLRARKRRDFEIWARAVDRWSALAYDARSEPAFHAAMKRDAELIRQIRRYDNTPPPALDGPDEALLAYLGGFFSGEGCFGLSGLQPRAVIKLRADDRLILELLASRFGLGKVREHAAPDGANPSVTWVICATGELASAVCLFDAAQLRGRKRREFEVWRHAAYERASARLACRPWDRACVEGVAARLKALRPYRQPTDPATGRTTHDDARSAYSDVLRVFAAETPDGSLTCTAYARARERHPEWPMRNTITLAFGSWAEALRAAGLGSRASTRSRNRQRERNHLLREHLATDLLLVPSPSMGRSTAELAPPSALESPEFRPDLCWLLSRASYTLTTELTAAFEKLGLSPRAHCVLSAAMSADRTQTEIARMVGLDKTTMVVTLDELEAAGLAERRPSPEDRRARVIAVTPAGKRKVREAQEIADRVRADVLSVLSERDREVFLDALTQLVTGRLAEPVVCSQPVRRRAPRA